MNDYIDETEIGDYISEDGKLRARFLPRDEGLSAIVRLYLPVMIVTMEETVIKENTDVPIVRITEDEDTIQ